MWESQDMFFEIKYPEIFFLVNVDYGKLVKVVCKGDKTFLSSNWHHHAFGFVERNIVVGTPISLSHDDEYPPFLGGIQFSLTNADN